MKRTYTYELLVNYHPDFLNELGDNLLNEKSVKYLDEDLLKCKTVIETDLNENELVSDFGGYIDGIELVSEGVKSNDRTYLVTDIEYDLDGEFDESDLPSELEIEIPEHIDMKDSYDVDEYISEEISNRTGFLHKGFLTTPEIIY